MSQTAKIGVAPFSRTSQGERTSRSILTVTLRMPSRFREFCWFCSRYMPSW